MNLSYVPRLFPAKHPSHPHSCSRHLTRIMRVNLLPAAVQTALPVRLDAYPLQCLPIHLTQQNSHSHLLHLIWPHPQIFTILHPHRGFGHLRVVLAVVRRDAMFSAARRCICARCWHCAHVSLSCQGHLSTMQHVCAQLRQWNAGFSGPARCSWLELDKGFRHHRKLRGRRARSGSRGPCTCMLNVLKRCASRSSAVHLSMHAVQMLMSCVHSAVGARSGKENEGNSSVKIIQSRVFRGTGSLDISASSSCRRGDRAGW